MYIVHYTDCTMYNTHTEEHYTERQAELKRRAGVNYPDM